MATVEIEIKIPSHSDLLIKEGESVNLSSPLFKKTKKSLKTISLAKVLHIKPKKIFKHLTHFVGDEVKKGEVIAIKKGFFSTQKIRAEEDGVIKEINHETGEIVLEREEGKEKTVVYSPVKGKVINIQKNKVIIALNGAHIFPLKKAGKDIGGKIVVKEEIPYGEDLSELQGNILVTPSLTQYLITKLDTIGARGAITLEAEGGDDDTNVEINIIKKRDDFKKILGYNQSYCFINSQKKELYIYE